jgi:hypothetical protein
MSEAKKLDEIMLKRLRSMKPQATPAELHTLLVKARAIFNRNRVARRQEKVRFAVEIITHILSLGILGFGARR